MTSCQDLKFLISSHLGVVYKCSSHLSWHQNIRVNWKHYTKLKYLLSSHQVIKYIFKSTKIEAIVFLFLHSSNTLVLLDFIVKSATAPPLLGFYPQGIGSLADSFRLSTASSSVRVALYVAWLHPTHIA